MIQGTKMNKEELETFKKKIGYWKIEVVPTEGALGGLATLFNPRKVAYESMIIRNNWKVGFIKRINCNLNFILVNNF